MQKGYFREDKRAWDELRPVKIKRSYLKYAEGSCLIEMGNTKVICSVSVEEKVPSFLKDSGTGWVTAEYGMIPRSCETRIQRESRAGRANGRAHEIQRLIGRSLRAVVALDRLGERTLWVDCDVIQGDGGTRCASVTGSFIALVDALEYLRRKGSLVGTLPIKDIVVATSVGIVKGKLFLDLTYQEDSQADVDMNIVMTEKGELVEIQGTAEHRLFDQKLLLQMLTLARKGVSELVRVQRHTLKPLL